MVQFDNINAYKNFMRFYLCFKMSDKMMSTIDYSRRLYINNTLVKPF